MHAFDVDQIDQYRIITELNFLLFDNIFLKKFMELYEIIMLGNIRWYFKITFKIEVLLVIKEVVLAFNIL